MPASPRLVPTLGPSPSQGRSTASASATTLDGSRRSSVGSLARTGSDDLGGMDHLPDLDVVLSPAYVEHRRSLAGDANDGGGGGSSGNTGALTRHEEGVSEDDESQNASGVTDPEGGTDTGRRGGGVAPPPLPQQLLAPRAGRTAAPLPPLDQHASRGGYVGDGSDSGHGSDGGASAGAGAVIAAVDPAVEEELRQQQEHERAVAEMEADFARTYSTLRSVGIPVVVHPRGFRAPIATQLSLRTSAAVGVELQWRGGCGGRGCGGVAVGGGWWVGRCARRAQSRG